MTINLNKKENKMKEIIKKQTMKKEKRSDEEKKKKKKKKRKKEKRKKSRRGKNRKKLLLYFTIKTQTLFLAVGIDGGVSLCPFIDSKIEKMLILSVHSSLK